MQAHAVTRIRWALHALVIALTVGTVAVLPSTDQARGATWAAAVVMVLVHLVGVVALPVLRDGRADAHDLRGRQRVTLLIWFVALLLAWLMLLWLSVGAAYVAFPLFFLSLHLLGMRLGVVALVVELVATEAGMARHYGGLTWPLVLGPTIGAAVAVATVMTFNALVRESDHRQRLITELESTRADLSAAQHDAGVMAERERLAGEIHDTLAQEFQGISLLLASALRALPDSPAVAEPLVVQARESSLSGLAEARQLVAALAPADLTHTTLVAALARLADRSSTPDLLVTLEDDLAGRRFQPEVEVALLRVAQSAVANAVRHSGAHRCTVQVSPQGLVVSDDGRGFDPRRTGSGYGLELIRRRLDEIGWRLVVTSSGQDDQRTGTVVEATPPA
ncbi:sensor histidine kinase [Aestuariimicrobium kwangyangense]|uniref:sensor histidine kinase n=1 Tax=Aestuariimicrobium kwangyangense TaxID=396389 RepID=UPI0003B477B1|nr:histidine kinase [Aestuariimicrobium kwangyangense]